MRYSTRYSTPLQHSTAHGTTHATAHPRQSNYIIFIHPLLSLSPSSSSLFLSFPPLLLLLLTCTSSIGVSRKRTEDVSRWIRSCSKPINKPHMGSSDVTVVPILGPLPRPGWEAITSLTMLYTSSRYTLRGREEGGERKEERGRRREGA